MPEIKEAIYEPRKYYNEVLKDAYREAANEKFNELLKESGVDEEGAKEDARVYYEAQKKAKEASKVLNSQKAGRTFCIVMCALFFVVSLIFLFVYIANQGVGFLVGFILCLLAGIGMIVLICASINKKLKSSEDILKKLEQDEKAKKALCWLRMERLNRLYDWNMPATILKKVTPILDIDRYFSAGRFNYLVEKFGFPKDLGEDTSVLGVVSGNIQGNPFALVRELNCRIRDIAYHGSLTISWTETYRDSNGTHTVTKTETLYATVYHEGPGYYTDTYMLYGNEAAPNLHFSRSPVKLNTEQKNEVERYVKKKTKELQKKAKADLMDNDPTTNFTMTGNNVFDSLFGATNRDNEVEFRLLYTPLAMKNVLDLLMNKEPYGDDFSQRKNGVLNIVSSSHSQRFNYDADPRAFATFDINLARQNFVSYCADYVQGLYFDLAPLLSIPLYQSHMPEEYIYGEDPTSHFSNYEHEVMINGISPSYFRPEEADPDLPLILKVMNASKEGEEDHLKVHAYSYKTTPRIDYVQQRGGDGKLHSIPVPWTQYDYVEAEQEVGVTDTNDTQTSYAEGLNERIRELVNDGPSHFERGLLCFARMAQNKE